MPPPVSFIAMSAMPFTQLVTPVMFNVAEVQWFKYTAAVPVVMGLQVTMAGTFEPLTTIYAADGTTPYSETVSYDIGHWWPLFTAADYYIQVTRVAGGASDADFTVSADIRPLNNFSIDIGDLIINDDEADMPAIVLAPTGTVKGFVSAVPGGEIGAVLPSGASFWHDLYGTISATERIAVYDGTRTYVTSVACGLTGSTMPAFGTDVTHNQVYVRGGNRELWTISAAGVAAFTGYSFPAGPAPLPEVMAATETGTVLYWATVTGHLGVIYALDLTTFTPLADFYTVPGFVGGLDTIAPTPHFHPGDMFVLPNGNVVTWWKDNATSTYHLIVLSPAGALLYSYDYNGSTSPLDHLAYIPGDSDHILAWWFTNTSESVGRYGRITLATGVVDEDFTVSMFSMGGNLSGADMFGPSSSCTFTRVPTPSESLEPPTVPPETVTDTRHIRRLRRAPHVTNENARVFVRRFELDLERGQGLATGQGSDPIVMLRLSRDGGQTWGEEVRMSAGALGAYTQRVLARRLGHARDTVFEVTVSDPIAWSLVGAWLDLDGGSS